MEEGEIIDDEEVDYTPLQRPADIINVPRPTPVVEDSEPSEAEESESDDSDNPHQGQKKQKLKPSMMNREPSKLKKYNVWSSGIQEEVLTQELTNCEVAQRFERNRDVESYDYTRYRQDDDLEEDVQAPNNKRQYDDRQRKGVRGRLGRRRNSNEGNVRGTVRNILPLTVTVDNTEKEVAKDIANKLCEEKDELILRVVEVIGKAKAIEMFELTKKIEENGGMLIMNQTRRRTPGGVFLFHVKSGQSQEVNQKIFTDDRRQDDAVKRTERSKVRRERAARLQKELEAKNLLGEPRHLPAEPLSGEEEYEGGVSNPPPSPVTDGRADSSPEPCPVGPLVTQSLQAAQAAADIPQRTLTSYDDFLDLNASFEEMDNMDVF